MGKCRTVVVATLVVSILLVYRAAALPGPAPTPTPAPAPGAPDPYTCPNSCMSLITERPVNVTVGALLNQVNSLSQADAVRHSVDARRSTSID